ncbi:hypothetical protein WR25_19771 [Diploscapter pachys]|uniref:Uncharacterized protein n=1 Tax=Diploscapter pachys TaxID=2018661 RepID=A0A2A2L8M3_9BILA|nr:hypothetical protein WR25_19771 [Diploscapter pachys]
MIKQYATLVHRQPVSFLHVGCESVSTPDLGPTPMAFDHLNDLLQHFIRLRLGCHDFGCDRHFIHHLALNTTDGCLHPHRHGCRLLFSIRQTRQSIRVPKFAGPTILDIVRVCHEPNRPSMEPFHCHDWQSFLRSKDLQERLVISEHEEFTSIEVLLETFYTVDDPQSFLLNLGVIPLCGCQRPRRVLDHLFHAIAVPMVDDCSNPVFGRIRGQDDRHHRIEMCQRAAGCKHLLDVVHSGLFHSRPLPLNVLTPQNGLNLLRISVDATCINNVSQIRNPRTQERTLLLLQSKSTLLQPLQHFFEAPQMRRIVRRSDHNVVQVPRPDLNTSLCSSRIASNLSAVFTPNTSDVLYHGPKSMLSASIMSLPHKLFAAFGATYTLTCAAFPFSWVDASNVPRNGIASRVIVLANKFEGFSCGHDSSRHAFSFTNEMAAPVSNSNGTYFPFTRIGITHGLTP